MHLCPDEVTPILAYVNMVPQYLCWCCIKLAQLRWWP